MDEAKWCCVLFGKKKKNALIPISKNAFGRAAKMDAILTRNLQIRGDKRG